MTQLGLKLLLLHTGVEVDAGAYMAQVVAADVGNAGDCPDVGFHKGGEPLAGAALPLAAFIAGTGAEGTLWRGVAEQGRGVGKILRADAAGQIDTDGGLGDVGKLDAAELAALAALDGELAVLPVEIRRGEVQKLGVAELGGQKHDDDGVIPGPCFRLGGGGLVVAPKLHHLLVGEKHIIGTAGGLAGVGCQAAGDRIVGVPAAALGVAGVVEKGAQPVDVEGDGVVAAAAVDQVVAPQKDGGVGGVGVVLFGLDEEVDEVLQRGGVRLDGAGGSAGGGAVFDVGICCGAKLALGGRAAGHRSFLLPVGFAGF